MKLIKPAKAALIASFVAMVTAVIANAGTWSPVHPYTGTPPINYKLCNQGWFTKYECNPNTGACMATNLETDKCQQVCMDTKHSLTQDPAKVKYIRCQDAN